MTDPKRAVAVDLSLHNVTGLWRGRASEAGSHRYEFEERIYSGMKRCFRLGETEGGARARSETLGADQGRVAREEPGPRLGRNAVVGSRTDERPVLEDYESGGRCP